MGKTVVCIGKEEDTYNGVPQTKLASTSINKNVVKHSLRNSRQAQEETAHHLLVDDLHLFHFY